LVNDELGNFKLEHKIKKGVFLAPKVYALMLENGEELIKNKGVKVFKDKEGKNLPIFGMNYNLIIDNNRLNNKPFRFNEAEKYNLKELNFDQIANLLNKNQVFITEQEKFIKNLNNANINIIKTPFTLSAAKDNKRLWLYDGNNRIIGTKPIELN
jgi:hypothetical protein